MREGVPEIKNPKNAQPVLLAAVGEEMHCLALHALAAALAEKKIESFFLGARTPLEAIDAMVTSISTTCDISMGPVESKQ